MSQGLKGQNLDGLSHCSKCVAAANGFRCGLAHLLVFMVLQHLFLLTARFETQGLFDTPSSLAAERADCRQVSHKNWFYFAISYLSAARASPGAMSC